MFSVQRILVPTDFSDCSKSAWAYASGLAAAVGARLYFLHVPGPNGENFEADFPFGPFDAEGAGPPPTGNGNGAPRPEFAVRIGPPAEEIVRYARDRDVDLIVMGTHGRSGVAHMLMGSVAERVIRSTGCPVLVVRRPVG